MMTGEEEAEQSVTKTLAACEGSLPGLAAYETAARKDPPTLDILG